MGLVRSVGRLRRADVPLGPFADPLPFFRAESGKVLHADASCYRARRHRLLPTSERVPLRGDVKVCRHCEGSIDGAAAAYLRAGGAVIDLCESVDTFVASEDVTWPQVLLLQRRIRFLESALAAVGRCDLDDVAAARLAEANAAVASRVPADGDLGVRRRVAISSLSTSTFSIPKPTDGFQYPLVLNQSKDSANALTATWREYSNAVHSGAAAAEVRDRAWARALTVLAPTPSKVDHVPDVDLSCAPTDGSLHDWLAELYVAHRDVSLTALLDFWDGVLLAEMSRPEWASSSLVAHRSSSRLSASAALGLLVPYERITTPGAAAVAFVVPTPVAAAVEAQTWRTLEQQRSSKALPDRSLAVVDFDAADRDAVATALTLWDADTPFDEVWAAARLVAANAA